MSDAKELKFDGCWAVVTMETGHMYIGHIVKAKYTSGTEEEVAVKGVALAALAHGAIFHMDPVFEYSTPLQPTPRGMTRGTVVLPPGVTKGVPIYGRPTSMYFFEDMDKETRQHHEELLAGAYESIQESRVENAPAGGGGLLDLSTGTDPRVIEELRKQGKIR